MTRKQKARLAAVQAAPVWLDRDATVDKACRLIREAGAAGADLVGFPENFIPGHPSWYHYNLATSEKSLSLAVKLFEQSVEIPSESTDLIAEAAAQAGINVVMGLTERRPDTLGTLFNTQLFIDSSGHIVGKHQKLVPTIGERMVHANGGPETQQTFRSEFGQVSTLVCGENSNPFAISMVAAAYPSVHVASWPDHFNAAFSMRDSCMLASKSFAYMCKCFVICSCGVNSEAMINDIATSEEDVAFMRDPANSGGSCIIGPNTQVLAGPMPGGEEGIIYADVDFEDCVRGRMIHDVAGHYNRPDVFQLRVNTTPYDLVAPAAAGRQSLASADIASTGASLPVLDPAPSRLLAAEYPRSLDA